MTQRGGTPAGQGMAAEEAWAILRRVADHGVGEERIPLDEALGRVLSRDIPARSPVPPFDASRMDGFGVGPPDDLSPLAYRVVSVICAGSPVEAAVGPGEAVRIMTGAPVPPGVIAVVPFEELPGAARGAYPGPDERITLAMLPAEGHNVFRAGTQAAAGQILMHRGSEVDAESIGRVASAGVGEVLAYRRPRVGILPTGSELAPLGAPLPPGRIFNSNRPLFAALGRTWHAEPVAAEPPPDEVEAIAEGLARLADQVDCIVATGGVSGGDRDLMRTAWLEIGAETLVDGIDVHPGGQMAIGSYRGKLIFGLSGSPGAALAMATLFLKPVLRVLGGGEWPTPIEARLRFTPSLPLIPRRALPVRITRSGPGLVAEPVPRHNWQREMSVDGVPGFWLTPLPPERVHDGMAVEVFPVGPLQ